MQPGTNHIWFVLPKLQVGGIERNRLRMIRQCRRWGIHVEIILVEERGALLSDIPADVPVHVLDRPFKAVFPLRLAALIRRNRPGFLISAVDDVNVMVALAQQLSATGTPMLFSNHNALSVAHRSAKGTERIKNRLLRKLLPRAFKRARAVVAVSNGVADDLATFLDFPRERISVIYNPVIERESHGYEAPRSDQSHPEHTPRILFVGRFVEQKDIPTLLAAFAALLSEREAQLTMVGDGPLREAIEAEARQLGIERSISFTGEIADPLPLMQKADLLVLSSQYEGLGNVLIEAMSVGTQIVSTDCPHGPSEILEDGRWGQLVPVGDPVALAGAMRRSLDGEFRVGPYLLQKRAREFTVERATRRYLELVGFDVSQLAENATEATRSHPASG